jgi:hypothetical protein
MFGKHWTLADGTVVATRIASTSGDGMVSTTEFVVDVRTAQGETFRAKVGEPRIVMDFKAPIVGAVIKVEVEERSRKVRFYKDDPAMSWKAYRSDRKDAFEDTLAQPAGSQSAGTDAVDPQLAQLEALVRSSSGGVIRLDAANNPDAAALREMLLRAAGMPGAPGAPPATQPDDGAATS